MVVVDKKIYQFLILFLGTYTLCAQNNIATFNTSGQLESIIQYNGFSSPVAPQPMWQSYLNYQQTISVSGVPISFQGGLTNLMIGQQARAWYPNYIRTVYRKDDFQKILQERYIQILEDKAEKELKKQQEIKRNKFKINQINEWLSKVDTNSLLLKIDSLSQIQSEETNTEIQRRQKQLRQIRQLYKKQQDLIDKNKRINVNDSVLTMLNVAKTSDIDFRGDKMAAIMNMNNYQQFMYSLDEFKGGRFYLDIKGISEYTNIDGVQIKIKPGTFYLNTTAGKVFQGSYYNSLWPDSINNKNNIYVLGITAGNDNGKQNIAAHYYYFIGNTSNISQIRNTVLGTQFDRKITQRISAGILLTGSKALNAFNQQDILQVQGVSIAAPNSLQNTFSDIVKQNKSVLFQTGYKMEVFTKFNQLFSKQDRWYIAYETISPFYQNMAMPFLLKGSHGLTLKNHWSLFKNKWILTTNYQYKEADPSGFDINKTFWTIAGAQIEKRAKKWLSKTRYNLINRNNTSAQVNYHSFNQIFRLQTTPKWQIVQTLFVNILFSDSILNQQYNYQLNFSPAKYWKFTFIAGWNVLNTEYIIFNVIPTYNKQNWQASISFQMIGEKQSTHYNVSAKINRNIKKQINIFFETGYGVAPLYSLYSPMLYTNYWTGSLGLRYNWNK